MKKQHYRIRTFVLAFFLFFSFPSIATEDTNLESNEKIENNIRDSIVFLSTILFLSTPTVILILLGNESNLKSNKKISKLPRDNQSITNK